MLKIAGTGLDGLVGSRIVQLLKDDFVFTSFSKDRMDITKRDDVEKELGNIDFDIFLHLAAFTEVDKAEIQQELAWNINVTGTKNVFDVVNKKRKKFIYVSTGFVFDGKNPPFYEDTPVNPLSVYGKTKYEGEKVVGKNGVIVRIDYPYGSLVDHKTDFVTGLLNAFREHKSLGGVEDQIITPTYIDDIAYSLKHLFTEDSQGVYHLVGSNSLSAYDMVCSIGHIFDFDTSSVRKISCNEFYKGKAPRPLANILKSKKNTFHPMLNFEKGLSEYKKRIMQNSLI